MNKINSNLKLFSVITASKHIYLNGNEYRIEGLEYPHAIPEGSKVGGAFVSIAHSSIQATIRNIAGTAANVTINNLRSSAADGVVYLSILCVPKLI